MTPKEIIKASNTVLGFTGFDKIAGGYRPNEIVMIVAKSRHTSQIQTKGRGLRNGIGKSFHMHYNFVPNPNLIRYSLPLEQDTK